MTEKKKERWYLKPFPCECETEYWFEVTEIEVPTKGDPGFADEREYLYYCHTCKKNKVVVYTYPDIRRVVVPDRQRK